MAERRKRRSREQRIEDEQDAARNEITAQVQRAQRARELERLQVAAAALSIDKLACLARYSEFILAHDRARYPRAAADANATDPPLKKPPAAQRR